MEKKLGTIVYHADATMTVRAYRIITRVTALVFDEEKIYYEADKRGNEVELRADEIFDTPEEAREALIAEVQSDHLKKIEQIKTTPVDNSYIDLTELNITQ